MGRNIKNSTDSTTEIKYVEVLENTHFFSDLNQILEYLKHQNDIEYLKIGLKNSLIRGLNIK